MHTYIFLLRVNKVYLLPQYNSKDKLDGKELSVAQINLLCQVIDLTDSPVKPSNTDKKFIRQLYGKKGM